MYGNDDVWGDFSNAYPQETSPVRQTVEVVVKGGRPWGFTLSGGLEYFSPLTISELEPGGKAEHQGVLKIGDEILSVNDITCHSRSEAIQLIHSAFKTLTLHVRRVFAAVHLGGSPGTSPASSSYSKWSSTLDAVLTLAGVIHVCSSSDQRKIDIAER